jgi:hypothetical protein
MVGVSRPHTNLHAQANKFMQRWGGWQLRRRRTKFRRGMPLLMCSTRSLHPLPLRQGRNDRDWHRHIDNMCLRQWLIDFETPFRTQHNSSAMSQRFVRRRFYVGPGNHRFYFENDSAIGCIRRQIFNLSQKWGSGRRGGLAAPKAFGLVNFDELFLRRSGPEALLKSRAISRTGEKIDGLRSLEFPWQEPGARNGLPHRSQTEQRGRHYPGPRR